MGAQSLRCFGFALALLWAANLCSAQGTVSIGGNAGVGGATVLLSGSLVLSTTCDAGGTYMFSNLPTGGVYTVTPYKQNYAFAPASITFSAPASNQTANFLATLNTYTISGQVVTVGGPASGILIGVSGWLTATTTTDALGRYSFTGLIGGGSFTVTPGTPNYSYSPPSATFSNLSSDHSADFTATLKTFAISGNTGVSSTTLTLGGSQSGTYFSDNSGNYLIPNLPAGGSYVLTPTRSGYTFSPPSQTFTNLSADQTGNFVPSAVGLTLSGNAGVAGATLQLTGSQTASTASDVGGAYTFSSLASGGSYTITPSKAGYSFMPPSSTFASLTANQIANFTATAASYSISGNAGVAGASLALSGSASAATTADSSGTYAFTGLASGGSFTVTPTLAGYSFSPASLSFSNLGANQIGNFAASTTSYSISGNTGVGGATVALSGTATAVTTADSSGTYAFTGLAAGGTFTVTPSKSGYSFVPASLTFPNLAANQVAGFTASAAGFSITGNAGVAGASLALSGSATAATTADSGGAYTFTGLAAGGTFTVTPAKSGYSFSPASLTFSALAANQIGNFTASATSYTISGNAGVAGATVALSGAVTSVATSDVSGLYAFAGLAGGASFTVTPSKSGYSFSPASLTFSNLAANQTANFTASAVATYSISGNAGVAGATLLLTGASTASVVADGTGAYAFSGLAAGGGYTVMPSLANYSFTPASASFSNLSANQTANFSATLSSYTISGNVGVGGVTLQLSGARTASAVSTPNGDFSFSGLPAGSSYTIVPVLANYTFTPPNAVISSLNTNQTVSFVAQLNLHDIYGNTGVAGATVILSGSVSGATTADGTGTYFFVQLPAGGSYTITPSLGNYGFTPRSVTISSLTSSRTVDFSAAAAAFSIYGNVGVAGATVALGGSLVASVSSDSQGDYSFVNLPALGNYTVTPSLSGYSFTPSSRAATALAADAALNFSATQGPAGITLSLNRTALYFAATSNGSAITSSQDVVVGLGGGSTASWSATSDTSWLQVTPSSGTGKGKFTVSIVNYLLPVAGSYSGNISVSVPSVSALPLQLPCTLVVYGTPKVPYGYVDSPAAGATGIAGSLAVTGWALDDIEVTGVGIWRDPVSGETASGNGYVFVGNAVFVSDARPDVESAYTTTPLAYRGGWGYMLLTNFLPGGGNSTFRLHALATDRDGHTVELGARSFPVDNAHSLLPFGTIDTPAQGGVASGASYVNFGWALTPSPALIPIDGSTIRVFVDGVLLGHPVYNQYRSDIATQFPSYLNSAGGVGYYVLNTTQLSDGAHSISWAVTDNALHAAGVGSRYFTVQNGLAGAKPRLALPAADTSAVLAYRRGYADDTPLIPLAEAEGDAGASLAPAIEVTETDRLQIVLPAAGMAWEARQLRPDGALAPLPAGSTLDSAGGVFYWQLGPAFLGRYRLEFRSEDGSRTVTIPVLITPAATGTPPSVE